MFEFTDLRSLEPVDNKYRPLRFHSSLKLNSYDESKLKY